MKENYFLQPHEGGEKNQGCENQKQNLTEQNNYFLMQNSLYFWYRYFWFIQWLESSVFSVSHKSIDSLKSSANAMPLSTLRQ